jgi:hypothetical protein
MQRINRFDAEFFKLLSAFLDLRIGNNYLYCNG